jgi:hypothetical protein
VGHWVSTSPTHEPDHRLIVVHSLMIVYYDPHGTDSL